MHIKLSKDKSKKYLGKSVKIVNNVILCKFNNFKILYFNIAEPINVSPGQVPLRNCDDSTELGVEGARGQCEERHGRAPPGPTLVLCPHQLHLQPRRPEGRLSFPVSSARPQGATTHFCHRLLQLAQCVSTDAPACGMRPSLQGKLPECVTGTRAVGTAPSGCNCTGAQACNNVYLRPQVLTILPHDGCPISTATKTISLRSC